MPYKSDYAKMLLDQGVISKSTYDAMVGGVGISVDPTLTDEFGIEPALASKEQTSGAKQILASQLEQKNQPELVKSENLANSDIANESKKPTPEPNSSQPLYGPLAPPATKEENSTKVEAKATPDIANESKKPEPEPNSSQPLYGPPAPPAPKVEAGSAPDKVEASKQPSAAAPKKPDASREDVADGKALPSAPSVSQLQPNETADQFRLRSQRESLDRKENNNITKKLAEQEIADARAEGAKQSAELINNTIQNQEEQIKRDEADKQASLAKAQQADDLARQRANELVNSKYDQNRYWKNLGLGGQIGTGVFAVLAGFAGAGANGRENPVLAQLDKNIDRDINLQQLELQNKKDGWEIERNVAAREYARDNDWLGFRSAKRLEALGLLKNKLDAIEKQTKSQEVQLQAKIAIAKLDDEIEDERNELTKLDYTQRKQKEQAAAQAAAAQAARVEKTRQAVRDTTKQLMVEHGMSYEDAFRVANTMHSGIDPGKDQGKLPKIPTKEEIKAIYSKDPSADKDIKEDKDTRERTVVVDGKEQPALSKERAGEWNKYNHARTIFANALEALKKAREAGDVGAYNSARATIIETYPELLGYSRAPTEAQIKVTVGPEVVPEYNHWYYHAPLLGAGLGTYNIIQGRAQEKINRLEETLHESDKAMRENTFGTENKPPSKPTVTDESNGFTGVKIK